MKYTYAYKESDGTRHEASINASSRDAVFALLREKGIRPIKVVAADGSKANGENHGVRRRFVFLAVITTFLGTCIVVSFFQRPSASPDDGSVDTQVLSALPQTSEVVRELVALPLARQQIAGLRVRVEELPPDFFACEAESFLARFAEPGRPYVAPESEWPDSADFESALKNQIWYAETEFTERIDLKRIVAGMKQELRAYLRGGGDARGYCEALIERQNAEISSRTKFETKLNELVSAGDWKVAYEYLLKANSHLQSMGIYPLSVPEALRRYQQSFDLDD